MLSEQPPHQAGEAVRHGLISTVYSTAQLDALDAAVGSRAVPHRVQLKVEFEVDSDETELEIELTWGGLSG